jgi:hypothetical protein
LLNKKGKFSRNNFVKNEVRVDIIFDTLEEARNYLKKDKNSFRRITSHMMAHGTILFQRGRSLAKIQTIAKNNLRSKTRYTKGEVLMHKYSIDDFWGEVQRDIAHKDYVAFGLDSHLLITNILELFLKLNGEFLRQPNEMRKVLKRLDKKFSDQIEAFYKANTIQSERRILSDLINYIYKKSKGPLPGKWFLRG